MEISRYNVQIRKESAYMETPRDNGQKGSIYKQRSAAPKSFFTFHSRKTNHFFQLPKYYLHNQNPWLTTLLLPWTS